MALWEKKTVALVNGLGFPRQLVFSTHGPQKPAALHVACRPAPWVLRPPLRWGGVKGQACVQQTKTPKSPDLSFCPAPLRQGPLSTRGCSTFGSRISMHSVRTYAIELRGRKQTSRTSPGRETPTQHWRPTACCALLHGPLETPLRNRPSSMDQWLLNSTPRLVELCPTGTPTNHMLRLCAKLGYTKTSTHTSSSLKLGETKQINMSTHECVNIARPRKCASWSTFRFRFFFFRQTRRARQNDEAQLSLSRRPTHPAGPPRRSQEPQMGAAPGGFRSCGCWSWRSDFFG